MNLSGQAKLVMEALESWAKSSGGRAFIAADALDCIDQLRLKPGRASAALLWNTEEPRGLEVLGRVDDSWKVVVSRGRSMKLQAGEALIEGAAGGPPMFELVEAVRDVVLALRLPPEEQFDDAELIPVYRGSGPFEVNGLLLDAVEIRFALAAQIAFQEGG